MVPPPTMKPRIRTRSAGRTEVALLVVTAVAVAVIFVGCTPPQQFPFAEAKSVNDDEPLQQTGVRGLTLRKRVHDVAFFDTPALDESNKEEGIVASDGDVGIKRPVRPTPGGATRPIRPVQQQPDSGRFGTGSCAGRCGLVEGDDGSCYCDGLCAGYNDCCDDACSECPCQVCTNSVDGTCQAGSCLVGSTGYCLPDIPANLAATLASDPQVTVELTWSAASGGDGGPATGFTMHRRTEAGGFAQIGQVSGGTTTYDDVDTLQPGTYYYAVKSTNAGGESGFSNEASVTVPTSSTCQALSGLELSTGFGCGGDGRSCGEIETEGIMFDIDGVDLSIDAFDLNVEKKDGEQPQVQVWTRQGTHQGNEGSSIGWTQIGPTYTLDGQGDGNPTRLTLSESIPINGRHALYFVQIEHDDIELYYDGSWTANSVQASDGRLTLYAGTRMDSRDAFLSPPEPSHGFSGTIIYTDTCDGSSSQASPSEEPSTSPSVHPSLSPSREHSVTPTESALPSVEPSHSPSGSPSSEPSANPSDEPSLQPSVTPSSGPSANPSEGPSQQPSFTRSSSPSTLQSVAPTESMSPSAQRSSSPSTAPSADPSSSPSATASDEPSAAPSVEATERPSGSPSVGPSAEPSSGPSSTPSSIPSVSPSSSPSRVRSTSPSDLPSSNPSGSPSASTPSPTTPRPTDCQDEGDLILSTGFGCGGGGFTCEAIETEGVMFDVDTEGSYLSVDAFDINIEKTSPEVQVWTRPGTHEGNEDSSVGWTQIGPTYTLDGQGDGNPTRVALTESVNITGRQAFYFLQMDNDDIELQYDNAWTLDTVHAFDDNLKIYVGTRKNDLPAFDSGEPNDRGYGFSGRVVYTKLCTSTPSPTTSSAPSVEPPPPTPAPSPSPTITPPPGLSPPPTGATVTYTPGDIGNGIKEAGLRLSKGLRAKIIAEAGKPVVYDGGGQSNRDFHIQPDGAGIFQDPDNPECYSYVSNSEVRDDANLGGVGAIIICDKDVIEYKWLMGNTERNCGGGKTPHGTWLSCEEHSDGSIWEIHPFGDPIFNGQTFQETRMAYATNGDEGFDKFESVAVDNRDTSFPVYYITVDSSDGELRRWKPDPTVVSQALINDDHRAVLASDGTTDYLVISGGSSGGTYYWTTNKQEAIDSAVAHYGAPEGIEFDDKSGKLFFSSKAEEAVFILDIDGNTYERADPAIDGHPDQLKLICSVMDDDESLLYFAEDGGDEAVYARTPDGSFYQIIVGEDYSSDETTGVAFSPDKMCMYFAMQDRGIIFQIWRDDNRPFSGAFNQLSDTAKEALAAAQATKVKEPNIRNPKFLTPLTPSSETTAASDDVGESTIRPGVLASPTTSKFDEVLGEKQAVFSARVGGRHRRPRPNY